VDGQNDNGWDQGLLFLNPWTVWVQPPCCVTQIISRTYLPTVVATGVSGASLDVTSKLSADSKTLQIQVVNVESNPIKARIRLEGFVPSRPHADVTQITGLLDGVNTAGEPHRFVPSTGIWKHELDREPASYTFPAYSFTVLQFR
jgi:alpha-L-arabinofuranosidase